jgi:hypothetical protein
MDTKSSSMHVLVHVLVDLNLATAVARPAVVCIYAPTAQLRGVAPGNLSKNSFLKTYIFLKRGPWSTPRKPGPFLVHPGPFLVHKKGARYFGPYFLAP